MKRKCKYGRRIKGKCPRKKATRRKGSKRRKLTERDPEYWRQYCAYARDVAGPNYRGERSPTLERLAKQACAEADRNIAALRRKRR